MRRCFNNNVVEAEDESGRRYVVTGKGLGFGLQRGDLIPEEKVSIRYVAETDSDVLRISHTVQDIPLDLIVLVKQLSQNARERLGIEAGAAFQLSLADHINGALKRAASGVRLNYPIYIEVTQLYPEQNDFARYVIRAVHSKFGTSLPPEESGAIALHLVADQFSGEQKGLERVMREATIINGVFEIIEQGAGVKIERSSNIAARFITHLRFLLIRLAEDKQVEVSPDVLVAAIKEGLPRSWKISCRVVQYLAGELSLTVGEPESAYIAMHIGRLLQPNSQKKPKPQLP